MSLKHSDFEHGLSSNSSTYSALTQHERSGCDKCIDRVGSELAQKNGVIPSMQHGERLGPGTVKADPQDTCCRAPMRVNVTWFIHARVFIGWFLTASAGPTVV